MWGLVLAGMALAADPAPIVERIEAHYGAVTSLQASFVQTVKSPLYGDDVQPGRMTLQRPGKMRWDFTGDGRVYVTDGKMLTMYTPDAKQAIQYPYTPTGADGLLQSLDRVGDLFTVTAPDPQPPTGVVVDLAPKTADGQLSKVRLTLSAGLDLQKIELTDAMGTKTEMVFTDVKAGAALDPATFQFVPPAGTQVISSGK